MGDRDIAEKAIEWLPDIFADIANAYFVIHGIKHVVQPDELMGTGLIPTEHRLSRRAGQAAQLTRSRRESGVGRIGCVGGKRGTLPGGPARLPSSRAPEGRAAWGGSAACLCPVGMPCGYVGGKRGTLPGGRHQI